MRVNLPVTGIEYELSPDAALVSRTDLKGRITYVNPAFVEASGFHVDRRNGWLWALDMGFIAGEPETPEGAQKVLVIDLASGRTVKRMEELLGV